MQVDFAIELGVDDETLEFPWAAPGVGPRYHDLKCNPTDIGRIQEAVGSTELRDFLIRVNAPVSILETAKCDVWSTTEINPEEEIFNSPCKFASYIDLIISDEAARFSLEIHERLLKELTGLLKHVPEIPASAEFLLRRCYYHEAEEIREGFYVTFYLFGFGHDEGKARKQWAIALELVESAIAQLSSSNSVL